MNKCKFCQSLTNNPSFCSRKCSTIYNNKLYPRRKWHCSKCNFHKPRPSKYATLCSDCNTKTKPRYEIIGLLRKAYANKGKLPHNVHVYIREKARRIIMHSKITSCEKCGYNKHIEVAHRIQVSSYSDNTLISTINERSNLMILCPNCHWEYDHL